MILIPPPTYRQNGKAIANKLCEWLEATTSYDEPSTAVKTERPPKWRRFYQFGPMLVMGGLLDADGKPTELTLEVKAVHQNQSVQPGEIITSGNGKRYMVQVHGSLRLV